MAFHLRTSIGGNYLKEWKSDDLEELAEFMSEVTDDERYENVMEMSLSQF